MSLVNVTRSQFPQRIRSRGDRYFQEGRVLLVEVESDFVAAEVQGEDAYLVQLGFEKNGAISVSCTCPYAQDGHFCKHMWATIREVDAEGLLQPTRANRRGQVQSLLWQDLEEAEPGGDPGLGFVADATRFRKQPLWEQMLSEVTPPLVPPAASSVPLAEEEILYDIDPAGMMDGEECVLRVMHRRMRKDGKWGKPRLIRFRESELPFRFNEEDRTILLQLLGARGEEAFVYRRGAQSRQGMFQLPGYLMNALLPRILATERARLAMEADDPGVFLRYQGDSPWAFVVKVDHRDAESVYAITGRLRRGDEDRDLASAVVLLQAGWVFWPDEVGRLDHHGAFSWIAALRKYGRVEVPDAAADSLLKRLYAGGAVRADLPSSLQVAEEQVTPTPRLQASPPERVSRSGVFRATIGFEYGEGRRVVSHEMGTGFFDADARRYIPRDHTFEAECLSRLESMGGHLVRDEDDVTLAVDIPQELFSDAVTALIPGGWRIEVEGRMVRGGSQSNVRIRSGEDWLDLEGAWDFDGQQVGMPRLLEAAARGERSVVLGDGSIGLLPDAWLAQYATVAGLGRVDGETIRFSASQGGLLDALMAAQPEVTCDEAFETARAQLGAFAGVEPVKAPTGFQGILRTYQEEGLGWMAFLRRFSFGGCLADDMGLGKTVQVLAMLEERRRQKSGPSLVVVPRSILFNWRREGESFTPKLRVLEYSGPGRRAQVKAFASFDLILTTYGTLRRDIALLKPIRFDYVILDEAQAIKNASTQAAKATRLLDAGHRLALTGTPVENHLGELWSLFEFLNPGMLGTASLFRALEATLRDPDEATRATLARAVRPFILRRTKGQVASELPDKVEDTLYCDLDKEQRREYDEIRNHYRASLLTQIDRDGIRRSKMQILEALLRLRQAACHPGLIDGDFDAHPSAKLDVLMAQMAEVLDEDHKVLVFSQFTKFLGIVRRRLDEANIRYTYLDGRTRKREERVNEFRNDPDCKAFLISLKAGGLGLNLVEAEYVYLLDPWWNPAVEAQAIDRAHRIGQTRTVFAYRLIARDTVEEKILGMQERKRALADAIISADNSVIRSISREDLELLLS